VEGVTGHRVAARVSPDPTGVVVVQRRCVTPVEAVFAVLADGWAYASWVVGASTIRGVDDGWPQPGARIHHSIGVWPMLIDDTTGVLEVSPPHRLVLQARAWPAGEATVSLELTPDGDGCLVRMAEDVSRGAGQLLPRRVRQLALAPRNRESLRRLEFQSHRHA
jgi:uncharacterized protein YndB with AHSA1/START domain